MKQSDALTRRRRVRYSLARLGTGMCSLNQIYLTEKHVRSTPQVSVLAQGPFAVGTGTSDAGPLGQGAGIPNPGKSCSSGGVGTPDSWRAPDRQGPTKQLVTITNSGTEQWIQLFTRRQSKSFLVSPYYACLLPLFAGQHRGDVTLWVQSSAGCFHSAQGYPAIHAL